MRTYTRDEVLAVVTDIGAEGTWKESFVSGAREVLRRLDALPESAPPTILDAPTPRHPSAERIHREMLGREVRAEWVAWARVQTNPKPSWLVPWEGLSEPDREVDRRIGERLYNIGRNGWNDPTPTPDGPALSVLGCPVVADPSIPPSEAHLRQEGQTVVRITNAEHTAPTILPESHGPSVVWTGDGVRVDRWSHGDTSITVDDAHGGREVTAIDSAVVLRSVCEVLARALAEAKREVETLNSERQETACEAIRRFASRLGDDATGFDKESYLEELEVALFQHVMEEQNKAREQAAESMREMAAKYVDEVARDGRTHEIRETARVLSDGIRALPLEEP